MNLPVAQVSAASVLTAQDAALPRPDHGKRFIIETSRPFFQSRIWQLQDAYFAERGVEAWRQGEVPHYVTSNPTIANAYAEIVFAFRRDLARLAPGEHNDPLTICELGAGSGRFAFHFLRRLEHLCARSDMAPEAFRYVLTDVADTNLEFWRSHPCFQPYIERGILDMARFDATAPGALALQVSGTTLAAGSLRLPPVVIGNYLFDSIPPDLFYLRQARAWHCLVSLSVDHEPAELDAAELLAKLQVHYDYDEIGEPPYAERWLQELLTEYRRNLQDTHLSFPASGLRCLQSLAGLSEQGVLVLSADKGEHRLERLDRRPAPDLVRHGSVSMSVNYHAFTRMCERRGGIALVPDHGHRSIDVIGLLMVAEAAGFTGTQYAYQRHVQEFGPDGFFTVSKHAREHIPQMSVDDILAYLRLSHHDSHLLARYLPRLMALAADFDEPTRRDVADALEKVWAGYFPLGEEVDLANGIAAVLYAMDDYARALAFFQTSMEIYGPDTGTLYNIGACFHGLGEDAAAAAMLRKVLEYDPGNETARVLLADCEAAAA
jgi:tetratricopeptide (TPR) repeat protein